MTIFALSTGPGISGIAVVRLSGKETAKVIRILTGKKLPEPRVATLRKINKINTSELIDEGLILWFPGPESYTGEDMAEIQVHGSKAVVDALHSSLSDIENCRLADPGEFTKLAFQNGKINLLEAESIADLISSETEIQRQQAIKIMNGKSADQFNFLREKLLKILSHVEAKIDFPDEDLPSDISKKLQSSVLEIKEEIEKSLDDDKTGEIIREGFKVAIIGPPNVGKSSLLNYLSKREAAIVSEKAGTTRDVVEVHLDIGGIPIIISDTAGIRASNDEIEARGIKLAIHRAEDADLNIILLDPKNLDFKGFLDDHISDKSIIVVNKSDLGLKGIPNSKLGKEPIIISLKEKKNIDKLIDEIKVKLKNQFLKNDNVLITRTRHRHHLSQCYKHLCRFLEKKDKDDYDKAAEDLRLSIRHIGSIVGRVDVEEILGSIFENFCIGK